MSSITSSSIPEDRYIAHLAGMQEGKKIIGFNDQYQAYSAQKRPVSNNISASIIGSIKGSAITSFGVLAYPLVNSSLRSSILGSSPDICLPCGANVKTATDLIINIYKIINPQETLPALQQKVASYFTGFMALTACVKDEQVLNNCRAANYIGGVWDTLSNNYMLVGAVTVGLAAFFTYSKMNTYAMQECQAEEDIKQVLTHRFGKIATRLTALEANQEVQECAKNILKRQLEINSELDSLQLPTLTWRDIEQITQPVFDAARTLTAKK